MDISNFAVQNQMLATINRVFKQDDFALLCTVPETYTSV